MFPILSAREGWTGSSLLAGNCSSYGIESSYERVEYSAGRLASEAISIGAGDGERKKARN